MKIVKYSKIKDGQIKASAVVGGGGGGSSTTIEGGGSVSLDRTIWGKHDSGEDIDGHMIVNGDIHIQDIDYNWEDDEDDGSGEDEEYDEGGGNLVVDLNTSTKTLEVAEDAEIGRHLYIHYPGEGHTADKVCVGSVLESVEKSITDEVNRAKEAEKALDNDIKAEVDRAEGVEAILDQNLQDAETAIRNNAEEIAKLKTRTTQAETDIANNALPVGTIIMFSGTMAEIPDGWAICNGENGTPNLIGKFVKSWTVAGHTGGHTGVTLTAGMLPKTSLTIDSAKIASDKDWKKRLNKYVPTLDKIEEGVYDEGGSSHYALYTGYKEGDNGLLGVAYPTIFDDVRDYTYFGESTPSEVPTEPPYYTLIFIMKIA